MREGQEERRTKRRLIQELGEMHPRERVRKEREAARGAYTTRRACSRAC